MGPGFLLVYLCHSAIFRRIFPWFFPEGSWVCSTSLATEDLDNCEYDFSNCSDVQSGESCEIKCNPPYVLAAPRQIVETDDEGRVFNGEDGDQNHGDFCGARVWDELSWIRFGYGYNMLQLKKTIQHNPTFGYFDHSTNSPWRSKQTTRTGNP